MRVLGEPSDKAARKQHCSNLHHWRLGPYHFNSQYAVAAPPKPNFLYFHTHTHSRIHAGVGIGQAFKHCAKSFPVALSLQHKVCKLKGAVRNVSIQLPMKHHILSFETGTITTHPTLIPFQETCCSSENNY